MYMISVWSLLTTKYLSLYTYTALYILTSLPIMLFKMMISDLIVQTGVHTPCHRKNSQSTVNHMLGRESHLVYKMRDYLIIHFSSWLLSITTLSITRAWT